MAWPSENRSIAGVDQRIDETLAQIYQSNDRDLGEWSVCIKDFAEASTDSTDWQDLGDVVEFPDVGCFDNGTDHNSTVTVYIQAKVDSGTEGEVRLTCGTDNGSASAVSGTTYADVSLTVASTDATNVQVDARTTSGTDSIYVQVPGPSCRAVWRA